MARSSPRAQQQKKKKKKQKTSPVVKKRTSTPKKKAKTKVRKVRNAWRAEERAVRERQSSKAPCAPFVIAPASFELPRPKGNPEDEKWLFDLVLDDDDVSGKPPRRRPRVGPARQKARFEDLDDDDDDHRPTPHLAVPFVLAPPTITPPHIDVDDL
mmetsp:Transcript_17706/g.54014  ORF Transcript_17706/g.54014 Transcript_17706/m.54014 type:complete len:156 (+) Transcript_17706:73-540(+)